MSTIQSLHARQILDSRGNPTVEVELTTEDGITARAAVPSGASTGKFEAVERRDNDPDRFNGKGVLTVCDAIMEEVYQTLADESVFEQRKLDKMLITLDGTDNKSRLGANATLGVSLAIARAAAATLEMPLYRYLGGVNAHVLPMPLMNILNGGKHADNAIDFQEFMVIPVGAETFSEALQMGTEVFHALRSVLKKRNLSTNVGDEGGFAPQLNSNTEAIELVLQAIEVAGYKPAEHLCIGIDAAANEFWNPDKKCYILSDSTEMDTDQMINFWKSWADKYPIVSLEDGLHEDDWSGWEKLHALLGKRIQLVGDDLFVTNVKRLQKGINHQAANSVLIKLNQIGTLSETLDAIELAHKNRMATIISHRSGETEDTFIADLAVAINTGQIKTGSVSRSDRVAKYNQLLRIEQELNSTADYGGRTFPYKLV